jgi:hypothetical protein
MPAAKKLKLDAVLKVLTPFFATDKKPEEIEAALRAAADALPSEAGSSQAVKDKRAADRKARDEKRAADRKARDEKVEAEDKARDEKMTKDRAARDAAFEKACDEADPEKTNDADTMKACDKDMDDEKKAEDAGEQPPAETGTPAKGGKSEPGTMDSATVATAIETAVKAEREAGKALRIALDKVAPVLGKVTFDSAPEAFRAGLTKLGVDHKGVADSALPALFDVATRTPAPAAPQAHDAASNADLVKLIPNINRL